MPDQLFFPLLVCPGRGALCFELDGQLHLHGVTINHSQRNLHGPQIFLRRSLVFSYGCDHGAQQPPHRGGLQQTTPTPLSPWAWVSAEVHWPGRRAAPCVSHAGTRMKAPWPPGAAPGHSTQVYLKPPLASRLRTGHRPKQISQSCLSGVRSPLCPPRSHGRKLWREERALDGQVLPTVAAQLAYSYVYLHGYENYPVLSACATYCGQ